MGAVVSSIIIKPKHIHKFLILVLGLSSSGKSSFLSQLSSKIIVKTPVPTFQVKTANYMNFQFKSWTIGKEITNRNPWRQYMNNAFGVIFIIDSANVARFDEAKDELQGLLRANELSKVPFLVLCNKQDLGWTMSENWIRENLGVLNMKRPWKVVGVSMLRKDSLVEALQWMMELVEKVGGENL